MRIFFFFVLCLSSFVCADTLTLVECVKSAFKNSPQLLNAQGSVWQARGGYISARAGYFPQLDILGSSAYSTENYTANFSLQQMIFDFGKTPAKSSGARLQWEAANLDSQSIIQNIILNTITTYYSYLQARAVKDVSEEAYRQAETHLDHAKSLMEAGRGVRFNVVKAEVDCANARLNLAKSRNSVEAIRLQLENVIGADIAANDTILDSIIIIRENIPADSAFVIALNNRSEAKASKLRAMAAHFQVSAASRMRWPVLSAAGTYGYQTSKISETWRDNWSAGLNISMPLFLGGSIRGSIEQAKGNLKQALALQTSTERAILLDVEQQMSALNEASERIYIGTKAVEQAELALTLAKERFSLGSGSALEMTDSELSLENAKIVRIQALSDYCIAQARLKRAMGILEISN